MINNTLSTLLEKEVFPFVDKPSRYIGGELHSVRKDPNGRTTAALIFPDLYEVGISNVGLKILYDILNRDDRFACERAYAPWEDMEAILRAKSIPLFTLESRRPIGEFDVIGITFQYELLYSNFLNILDMSGVPFRSKDRQENHPYVFGGGPVSCNLEPVAPFLDAVCVGDGESRIVLMCEAVHNGKKAGKSRALILKDLSMIPGVYVPGLYEEIETEGYTLIKGPKVRRYSEPDLNAIDFVTKQIVPNLQAVQDRAVIEVTRGCTRGCRFCQAGTTYRPVRERSVNEILSLARDAIRQTGYREFSLISLSISDYSGLTTLIESLDKQFSSHGVSFSLPSLRLDTFTFELAQKVKEIRKSGLTFAVEGGTQAIRDAINKGVEEHELIEVIRIAKEGGWKSVKLYFMIGLPGTTVDEEIEGIAALVKKIVSHYPRMGITVSVAVFIPKPHTPFQWDGQLAPQIGMDAFHKLIGLLRPNRNVNIRYNNPHLSWLEGVFSRGDRKLANALEVAFQKGARFDGWNDRINLDIWRASFAECGINADFYLSAKPVGQVFPWNSIDSAVNEQFLIDERAKAAGLKLTQDCREGCVNDCGTCDFSELEPVLAEKAGEKAHEAIVIDENFLDNVQIDRLPLVLCRFSYERIGPLKYLSPIDLEEHLSRALIRANLPVVYTKGFNPHIRIDMGWALPVGFSSLYEVAELELSNNIDPTAFRDRLNAELPQGIKVIEADIKILPAPRISRVAKEHYIEFSINNTIPEASIREALEKSKTYEKVTSKATKIISLPDYIRSIAFKDSKIIINYQQKESGARIQDIIDGLTGYDVRKAVTLDPTVLRRYSLWYDKEIELIQVK